MQVINIHKRIVYQPKEKVSLLFKTLASSEDLVWPNENWPSMKFKDELKVGSKGGHGLIRYTIIDFKAGEYIKFQFSKPEGFNGTHELKISPISKDETEICHEIKMQTSLKATFFWIVIVSWLHDALIEEAFDKVENYFAIHKKVTKYNAWVNFLRGVYNRKSFQTKQA